MLVVWRITTALLIHCACVCTCQEEGEPHPAGQRCPDDETHLVCYAGDCPEGQMRVEQNRCPKEDQVACCPSDEDAGQVAGVHESLFVLLGLSPFAFCLFLLLRRRMRLRERLADVAAGAAAGPRLEELAPAKKMAKVSPEEKNRDASLCIVCLGEMKTKEVVRALPCGHRFHSECLTKWWNHRAKCPYCQRDYGMGQVVPTGADAVRRPSVGVAWADVVGSRPAYPAVVGQASPSGG